MNPKFIDANVVSVVKFSLDSLQYQIIRDDKRFAIYDNENILIKIFNSVTTELGPYLSELFDFKPLFQSQSNDFIIPPPAYLILPYYIDQDDSWSNSWSAFKKLTQIKKYRESCIYYHSGIRPNSYYETKKDIDIFLRTIEETDKEQKITNKILQDVKEKLSQSQFNIDIEEFKNEIVELLTEFEKLKNKEEKIKIELHEYYHLKANYEVQVNIIKQAILESNKDLKFATEKLPQIIGCPTCGAEYENSFAERFEIAEDEQKCKDLLIEVKKEENEIDEKILKEKEKLSLTELEISRIDEILQSKKGDLQLKDVIESSGKNQIKEVFQTRQKELQSIIIENTLEKEKLEKKLKELESKKRKEEINLFFRTTLSKFLRKLDIQTLNEKDYSKITTKIETLETGSSKPRALIAYYYTFFHLMEKYSSTTYFPLIVDSPNQQDQDIEHIDKILKFIDENQPKNSQLILGVAETYGVDFNCKSIELTEKYSLLSESEYDNVYDEIKDKLLEIWE
jgi:hypothetical protein